mgnify:CR=1 FL=1
MNIYRQAIQRELRNAKRIISNPSLIEMSWRLIRSASKNNIYLDAVPYQQTCKLYEFTGTGADRPTHEIEG